jgi:chloride channel protein, CIC family
LPVDQQASALRLLEHISADFFRHRLAQAEALPQLVILAVITGFLTGMVILLFRIAIEYILGHWMLPGDSESFELLSHLERLLLPLCGALVLGIGLSWLPDRSLRVGVFHVIERLSRHQGRLPSRNALVQFFGGIIALITGFSGGREGPAVHLGAASSSLLGQALELPNNSIRTLVACGSAAAIAGSFNTPLAGVIFAMEVVMMDYTIASFIPVIVSAVTATLLTRYFIGPDAAFLIAPIQMQSLLEIPYVIFAGLIIGCAAAAFISAVQIFARLAHWPFWLRALFAGAITGLAAITVPEIMGLGYDTVNGAMLGQIGLVTLLAIVVFKILASAAAVGLGIPVGIIGPTFVIGAALGGALGIIGEMLQPGEAAFIGLYVMLGMAAMMAAVLQAPLAALMAVLELTANPNLILPAMLIVVVATMVTSVVFKQKSVFLSTLNTLGLQYPPNPVTLHLQRAAVSAIMNRDVVRVPSRCAEEEAREALSSSPRWVAVEVAPGEIRSLLNAVDLKAFLDEREEQHAAKKKDGKPEEIDLYGIPGLRMDTADIDYRATIYEAQEVLKNGNAEALCVRRASAPLIRRVLGVITQADIDNYRDTTA